MLPNLIIIGAMKCGTTSLHFYLSEHPQICMASRKELDFFDGTNWDKGLKWYESHFNGASKVNGESSPNYTRYPEKTGIAERMHTVIPQAKLIYLVRDPIERVISHYVHACAAGEENRSLSDSLADFDNGYIFRSKYFMQLEQYSRFYPRSKLLVLDQNDLRDRRHETLRYIFKFLEVDPTFKHREFEKIRHRSRDKRKNSRIGRLLSNIPGMRTLKIANSEIHWHVERVLTMPFSAAIERPRLDGDLRQRLVEHFRKDVRQLRDFSGLKLESWSV